MTLPIVPFTILYQAPQEVRLRRTYHPFTSSYKANFWWFEFVLLARRLVFNVTLILPFGSDAGADDAAIFCLLIALTFFLGFLILFQPFLRGQNNLAEIMFQVCKSQ